VLVCLKPLNFRGLMEIYPRIKNNIAHILSVAIQDLAILLAGNVLSNA
jgi:hypothetical protein